MSSAPVFALVLALAGSMGERVRFPAREAQYWLVTRSESGVEERHLVPRLATIDFEVPRDRGWRLAVRDSRGRLTDADLVPIVEALATVSAPGLEIISPSIPTFDGLAAIARIADLRELVLDMENEWPQSPSRQSSAAFVGLASLTKLERLELTGMHRLEDEPLAKLLEGAKHSRVLRLVECDALTSRARTSILALRELEELDLTGSSSVLADATTARVEIDAAFPRLRSLTLGRLRTVAAIDVGSFARSASLRSFAAEASPAIDDAFVARVITAPSLDSLDLSRMSDLGGGWTEALGRRAVAQALNLSACRGIVEARLEQAVAAPWVEIDLSSTRASDRVVERACASPALRKLMLRNCEGLTSASTKSIARVGMLESLDLRGCSNIGKDAIAELRTRLSACRLLSD